MDSKVILKEMTLCLHYIHVNKEDILGRGERMLKQDVTSGKVGRKPSEEFICTKLWIP